MALKTARDNFDKGMTFFEKQNYKKAIEYFQKAIVIEPQNPEFYEALGFSYYINQDIAHAIIALEKLIQLDSEHLKAMSYLAECYTVEENEEKAAEILERAHETGKKMLKNPPDDPDYFLDYAEICYKLKLYEDGVLGLFYGLTKYPDSYEMHRELADLYYELEMLNEAVEECSKAIELNPEDASSYLYLGLTCQKMNLLKRAIKYFKKSLDLNPSQSELIDLIAQIDEISKANGPTVEEYIHDATPEKLHTGFVKWFDIEKGIGAVKTTEQDDIFVHFSAVDMRGIQVLFEGEKVKFGVINNVYGNIAVKIRRMAPKDRVSGIVNWFDEDTGEGEIRIDSSSTTAFVHFGYIIDRNIKFLKKGEKVFFDPVEFEDDLHAYNVVSAVFEEKYFPKMVSTDGLSASSRGKITLYEAAKGFGMIVADDNSEYIFTRSAISALPEEMIKPGTEVVFTPDFAEAIDEKMILKAVNIRLKNP